MTTKEPSKRRYQRRVTGEGALLKHVRGLLEQSQIRDLEIFQATGIAPNRQYAIKAGKTPDPSVNTVEKLYVFLSGKPLEL